MKLDFKLDKWQEEVLEAEGNLCICNGRQTGKTEVVALKAMLYAVNNPKKSVLIVSITEEQAMHMLEKIAIHLAINFPAQIAKGKNKPTRHKLVLKNGSKIFSRAVGQYGLSILGLTIDILICDEASYMNDDIWNSATPMLLTTGGNTWLISTPNVMKGFFYEAYTKPSMGFKTFHISSEEVAEARPEPSRTIMLGHLAREKERMTKLEYAQKYLALFLEEQGQLFPDSLIAQCQTADRISHTISEVSPPVGTYFLGVDVARMGGDETTLEVFELREQTLWQRDNIVKKYTLTTETISDILLLDKQYNFQKIYIDDGGLGVAVFDQLLLDTQTRRKVIPINNSSRALDRDAKRKKKLLKEDLYMNLKRLMEAGKIKLLKDASIYTSLKSVVYEVSEETKQLHIYGRYTHIAEGIIRAAWSVREKGLNIYLAYN